MATIARVQILAPAVKGALENGPWRPFTFEGAFCFVFLQCCDREMGVAGQRRSRDWEIQK